MITEFPDKLNDGTYDYVLIRPETPTGHGPVVDTALYDQVPKNPASVFTPSLQWRLGQESVPTMIRLER